MKAYIGHDIGKNLHLQEQFYWSEVLY